MELRITSSLGASPWHDSHQTCRLPNQTPMVKSAAKINHHPSKDRPKEARDFFRGLPTPWRAHSNRSGMVFRKLGYLGSGGFPSGGSMLGNLLV
jgi:hypothetical protein